MFFRFEGIRRDGTQFYNVLNRLPEAVFERISAELENLPEQNKYGWIKKLLLRIYSKSDDTRCSQLLNLRQLGSSHPSVLLNEVKKLIPDSHRQHECSACGKVDILPPCPIAYTQFRSRLPQPIRRELPVKPKTWGQVAAEVEESWEAHYSLTPAPNPVAAVEQPQPTPKVNPPATESQVAAANFKPTQSRRRGTDQGPVVCWYHMQHGVKAQQCSEGCFFAQGKPKRPASRHKPQSSQSGRFHPKKKRAGNHSDSEN